MVQIDNLTTQEEIETGNRSSFYQLLSLCFRFPDKPLCEAIKSGEFIDRVKAITSNLPFELSSLDGDALMGKGIEQDLEETLGSEYIRLFDLGVKGHPSCPLYEGSYRNGRKGVMEDLVRFYNHFGLTLSREDWELPDHLTTELEFVHYLSFKELLAIRNQEDPFPYIRAQRDFLSRHPAVWFPVFREKLQKNSPIRFYEKLVEMTEAFILLDQNHLKDILDKAE
ncbi:MAG: molecular chaperone TorD family protein [Deltaproteobacteria bacterium]|nr:MAG: molecular chaperone TorD family protein [Deltaproteobacteria bacterium]